MATRSSADVLRSRLSALAVVAVVLRTFKPQELRTLLTKDDGLRQRLGLDRVPHRRTLARRLDATLPEAEAQVQALGQQILGEVAPGPDEPQASAIDGRMYQAQGPCWHKRDRAQGRIPPGCAMWTGSRRGPRVGIGAGCKAIG